MDAKPGQQCGEVRTSMNMQLQSWYEEGFILPGWQLEWDQDAGSWQARFHMRHNDHPYRMTEREFEQYVLGFYDRRTAVMQRRPPTARTGR